MCAPFALLLQLNAVVTCYRKIRRRRCFSSVHSVTLFFKKIGVTLSIISTIYHPQHEHMFINRYVYFKNYNY